MTKAAVAALSLVAALVGSSFAGPAGGGVGSRSPQWVAAVATTSAGRAPSGSRLLQRPDLVYQGAFSLPQSLLDRASFSYGGTALAYNPARKSLFVVGHDWYQLTAEVTIPPLVKTSMIGELNTAALIQPFTDATNDRIDRTGGTTNKVGGQLVYQGRLYGTAYIYYDAPGSQVASHWVRPSTSLTTGRATGLYRVGRLGAGVVSGYMAEIPPNWRSPLGGPALTGNCCLPIISRTSFGPAAFAFNPAGLGAADPVPVTPLVYYPEDHATLGTWDDSWSPARGILFNGTTSVRGVVFPTRGRSILFFGTQGTGKFCYGEGTSDPSLVRKPTPDGSIYCYDPDDSSKGTHGYPYVAEVWAYDANDFVAVKNGRKKPWRIKPYATWSLDLPFGSGSIGGATYDPRAGIMYLSQQFGNGTDPVIHAFMVR